MSVLPKLSLVEGSWEELALELAQYLDGLRGKDSTVAADLTPFLADPENPKAPQETDKTEALKVVVAAAAALNHAPERDLQAAYNLVIHLIAADEDPDMFLQRVCKYLSQRRITTSTHNEVGLALGLMGTLFNSVDPDDSIRFNMLLAIIEMVSKSRNYETLRPQLRNLGEWVELWELDDGDERQLYLGVSEAAASAGEKAESYAYLLRALRTAQDEPSSEEAHKLSIRAVKHALQNERQFDFQDLFELQSIQALRKTDETLMELLGLFSTQTYDDLLEFKEASPSFLADNGLDESILDRKMRLLTLTTLAAQSEATRTLPYKRIADALQIPIDDVETWVIDCIRSGLVEGKLSQLKEEFLIHRCTQRTFGDRQWREVASRLESWKTSLNIVLSVIRKQKEELIVAAASQQQEEPRRLAAA
ncbi:PCI-domain-containing protein [Piedraia hortae CBS 480.64]|uniref:Eukaryotic translation initiation factor 3 subunit M n=1 Tax=Piedraia hortae CBS 480.64 TaxID=1314780 RepID=A0A6A7C8W0_9PEZI|nr:PCI-domain-containing protein [Piedraia hortae CBS 480.64]